MPESLPEKDPFVVGENTELNDDYTVLIFLLCRRFPRRPVPDEPPRARERAHAPGAAVESQRAAGPQERRALQVRRLRLRPGGAGATPGREVGLVQRPR